MKHSKRQVDKFQFAEIIIAIKPAFPPTNQMIICCPRKERSYGQFQETKSLANRQCHRFAAASCTAGVAVCLAVHTRHFRHSASGDDDLRTAARGVQQAGQKVSEGVADRIQGAGSFRHRSILYAPGGAAERQGGSAAVPPQALSVYIWCVWRWKKRHI